MNTNPSYTDENRDIMQFESNKLPRIFFMAVFVNAVFIVPAVTAIHFLLSAFSQF